MHPYGPSVLPPQKGSGVGKTLLVIGGVLALGFLFAMLLFVGIIVLYAAGHNPPRNLPVVSPTATAGESPERSSSPQLVDPDDGEGEGDDDDFEHGQREDHGSAPSNANTSGENPARPNAPNSPMSASTGAGGKQFTCTAFASFRACGFANACGPRSASGMGVGNTEAFAREQALASCRRSVSAQNPQGVAICNITSCSAK
jgi:hypothetical protein